MPFHKQNILCEAKDVKAAGTLYSDVLAAEVAGVGDVNPIVLEVWSSAAGAGAGTLDITLQTSGDNFASDTTDVFSLPTKNAAALAKGKLFEGALPSGLKKDIRLKFVTTTGFTTAKISAAIRNRY